LQERRFGQTGRLVSEIGFGAWAIGANWGHVDESDALAAVNHALDSGVTFIDTADVYGDGRSEQLIARVLNARGGERPFVATKVGRRQANHQAAGYTRANLTAWIDRSLRHLQTDSLDLVQLHCPPTDVYYDPEVFGILDDLKREGKIRDYGVSVERVEEGLKAMEYPGVVSIQVIYNIFRQRPAALLFEQAKKNDVAIIARVPLASGLLTGKFTADSRFGDSDHRQFNRNGEAFDVGETFSGVPFEAGLAAVERIRPLVGGDTTMARFALRWILMSDAVSVAIPGARNAGQARSNAEAALLPPLSDAVMADLVAIYDQDIRPHVHQRW
jgi:aryl-alcohol dehydrogenase-like predicted oxidoreductase